eukprot:1391673-Amphidinium_carterae.1
MMVDTTALTREATTAVRPDGKTVAFDAVWSSSLTSSVSKGKPDIEVLCSALEQGDQVQNSHSSKWPMAARIQSRSSCSFAVIIAFHKSLGLQRARTQQ